MKIPSSQEVSLRSMDSGKSIQVDVSNAKAPPPARGTGGGPLSQLQGGRPQASGQPGRSAPLANLPSAEPRLEFDKTVLDIPAGAQFKGGEPGRHPGGERYSVLPYVQVGTGKEPINVIGIANPNGHTFEVFDQTQTDKNNQPKLVGTLSVVQNGSEKVGVNATDAKVRGEGRHRESRHREPMYSGPSRPRIEIMQSSSSVTGYLNSNGLACDSHGAPILRESRGSASGYRDLSSGMPCDRSGRPTVQNSQSSASGYRGSDGLPCSADGFSIIRRSQGSVTGYKTASSGLACDADGFATVQSNRDSRTGYSSMSTGLPTSKEGLAYVHQSMSSISGLTTSKGMPCDRNGNDLVETSRSSVTGFKDKSGLPCAATGHPAVARSGSGYVLLSTNTPCDKTGRALPVQTTPYHSGTANDCGLHTIAAMTGWSEQQVVQSLGLNQRDLNHIAAHGMEPNIVTAALQRINPGQTYHNQLSPQQFMNNLGGLPEGHQFALGMQRSSGIGHLVSAKRVGDSLVITDRQVGTRTTLRSPQDLADFLNQSGASRVHTWYE